MSLKEICDPNTPETALERVKMAHVRLARKLYARDPATAPPSGVRIPFVFVENAAAKDQYERAEDATYAKNNRLHIDAVYYLERQCRNAWGQILDTVCPGKVDGIYSNALHNCRMRREGQRNLREMLLGNASAPQKIITLEKKRERNNPATKKKKRRVRPKVMPGQSSIASFFSN